MHLLLKTSKTASLVLWGRSFGGYLAPQAFAIDTRIDFLVADGGVYDFYQNTVCSMPEDTRELFYNSDPQFNIQLNYGVKVSLNLDFIFEFGKLGFGVDNFESLFDAFEPYNMMKSIGNLENRFIYVNDPPFDSLTGNQSQIFVSHIKSRGYILMYEADYMRGGALHCSVGSNINSNKSIMRWLTGLIQ